MFGEVLLDQGWTPVQAHYTWRYEHVATLMGEGTDRFNAELRWKEAKAETGALSRIVCHLLGINRTQPEEQWRKPIVIVRDEPDMQAILDDPVIGPEMRRALAAKAVNATSLLYGGEPAVGETRGVIGQAEPLMLGTGANADEPEDDWPAGVDPETGEILNDPPERDDEGLAPEDTEPPEEPESDPDPFGGPYQCAQCGKDVTFQVASACKEHEEAFGGKIYCVACGKPILAEHKEASN